MWCIAWWCSFGSWKRGHSIGVPGSWRAAWTRAWAFSFPLNSRAQVPRSQYHEARDGCEWYWWVAHMGMHMVLPEITNCRFAVSSLCLGVFIWCLWSPKLIDIDDSAGVYMVLIYLFITILNATRALQREVGLNIVWYCCLEWWRIRVAGNGGREVFPVGCSLLAWRNWDRLWCGSLLLELWIGGQCVRRCTVGLKTGHAWYGG